MSRDEVLPRQAELAEARGRLEALGRDRAGLTRAQVAADREADDAASRLAARQDELLRADSLLAQETAEAALRREWVLTAPVDGRLTLSKAAPGHAVEPGQTLAQLLPEGAVLQAQLLAPSRAAGFVKAGTLVRLRYDAYPYQKFGQHAGVVVSVAAAPLQPAVGLAAPVAGMAEAQAEAEPLFPVTVRLPAQSMQALGKEWPLRAGMRVQAELLHESRRLYEWAFEPLQAWRVRMADPGPAPSGPPQP
jgi:membrane fusion protein